MTTENTIDGARTLANIAERALHLFDDGYTYKPNETLSGVYEVRNPKGDLYFVTCDPIVSDHCDCPSWEKHGTCKHFLAIKWMLEAEAEFEAKQNNDDDKYPEF